LRDVEESVERKWEIWETERRSHRRNTRRQERKRYKWWGGEGSHPFQKIANNQCHNRPNDTQDNIPIKKSLAK
jgi:hypothetical protein